MKKLVYLGIGLAMSTMIAGCGGRLSQENASKDQSVPIDSIMKNITINPKTYFKTLNQISFSLSLKDARNNPIVHAYVNVHEQGQTESVFKGMSGNSGTVSGSILVLSDTETLVVEVDALGYEKSSRTINLNDNNEGIKLESTLSAGLKTNAIGDPLTDTDRDGFPDIYDEYPADPALAYKINYPTIYLAYEDMYPSAGDMDVNDLVIKMAISRIYNSNDDVKQITGNAELMARGADARYRSDFHLKLDLPDKTAGTAYINLFKPNGTCDSSTTTVIDGSVDLNLFANTGTLFATSNHSLINTQTNLPYYKGSKVNFTIDFTSQLQLNDTFPYYDPYLMVHNPNGMSYDIHRPFTTPIVGSQDPITSPQNKFIDENNFPFCMIVPEPYLWPIERMRISNAFPDFVKWVQSTNFSGYKNWYKKPISSKVYTKHIQHAPVIANFIEVQSIDNNIAINWKTFQINGETYLVVANSSTGSNLNSEASYNVDSKIYKWNGSTFVVIQSIPTKGAMSWESFQIGEENYLVVANYFGDSKIYKWAGSSFVETQSITGTGTVQWKSVQISGETYLAAAKYYNKYTSNYNIDSKIYKWSGTSFVEVQSIPTNGGYSVDVFQINGETYLAVANAFNGSSYNINSKIYKWNGSSFTEIQSIPTNTAYDWESFQINGETYLAVANSYNGSSYNIDSKIYKWSGNNFIEVQSIPTTGAISWKAFQIKGETYLAVANGAGTSKIYKWNDYSFVETQTIDTDTAYNWESFLIKDETYVIVANCTDISKIYKAQ